MLGNAILRGGASAQQEILLYSCAAFIGIVLLLYMVTNPNIDPTVMKPPVMKAAGTPPT